MNCSELMTAASLAEGAPQGISATPAARAAFLTAAGRGPQRRFNQPTCTTFLGWILCSGSPIAYSASRVRTSLGRAVVERRGKRENPACVQKLSAATLGSYNDVTITLEAAYQALF